MLVSTLSAQHANQMSATCIDRAAAWIHGVAPMDTCGYSQASGDQQPAGRVPHVERRVDVAADDAHDEAEQGYGHEAHPRAHGARALVEELGG